MVLPQEGEHELVEEEGNHGVGEVGHHLGGAVPAGVQKHPALPARPPEPEPLPAQGEKAYPRQGGDAVARRSSQGGPGDAHIQRDDERIVQHRVGKARAHRQPQAQAGPPRSDKEALKEELEDAGRGEEEQDAQVVGAVAQQGVAGAQQPGHGGGERQSQQGEERPQRRPGEDQEGEITAGRLLIPLAQLPGHHGAAAGGQHDPQTDDHADKGVDDIYRRQGGGAHEPADEDAVHDGVERHENHHDDGRQSKPKKGPEAILPVQRAVQSIHPLA